MLVTSLLTNTNLSFYVTWSRYESEQSSTYREILALLYALKSMGTTWRDLKIKWYSDSMNAVKAIKRGSMNNKVHGISCQVFNWCEENRLEIYPHWLPRALITEADKISKFVDRDSWEKSQRVYELLTNNPGSKVLLGQYWDDIVFLGLSWDLGTEY